MPQSINIKKPNIKIRGDKIIWVIVLLLGLISIIMVYSSSSMEAAEKGIAISGILRSQIIIVLIGFVALLSCYYMPLWLYRRFSIVIFIIALVCMILLLVIGVEENGAIRWIPIFGKRFQPSEFAKIAMVLYLSRIFEVMKIESNRDYLTKMLPFVVLPIGLLLVIAIMTSGSLFVLLSMIILIMLLFSNIKWKYIGYTMLIGIAGVMIIFGAYFALKSIDKSSSPKTEIAADIKNKGDKLRIGTILGRIDRFFVKEDEVDDKGKKLTQSDEAIIAIQLGGIIGQGAGNSSQRYKIKYAEKDFIYSVLVEEWGIAGGIFVAFLYLIFLNRCFFIARRCTRVYSTLVVIGLSTLIFCQAMIHIFVNIGIIPVTGQTLPLVSKGGTSFLFMCIAFGIILSINKTIDISIEKKIAAGNEQKSNN